MEQAIEQARAVLARIGQGGVHIDEAVAAFRVLQAAGLQGNSGIPPVRILSREELAAAARQPVLIESSRSDGVIDVLELIERVLADPHAYVEVGALDGVVQDSRHHPEGDALIHTGHVVRAAIRIVDRLGLVSEERAVLLLAALCHDLGKTSATLIQPDGRITSYGHDEAGVEPTRSLLGRLGIEIALIERVVVLVREHMAHVHMQTVTPRVVRRLLARLGGERLDILVALMEADQAGRPPLPARLSEKVRQIVEVAASLPPPPPASIVSGRDLIAAGIALPGPDLGRLLAAVREREGAVASLGDALAMARELVQA